MDPLVISRLVYQRLIEMSSAPPPRVRTWTGEEWGPPDSDATLVLQHPGALRALLLPPTDLSAGEAYIYDDVDIEGNIFTVLEFAAGFDLGTRHRWAIFRLLRLLRKLPAESRRSEARPPRMKGMLHSLQRDRAAVTHHYDTGNDFFTRFLGPSMVYSCAYFLDPAEALDKAQHRKLDVICRKLQLAPGDRFLDIGCGWGSLVLHAAVEYGVTATGVTLSGEQAAYAREKARDLGVEDRVTIIQEDYREVTGRFEAIASIGMFEHVGKKQLGKYFERLRSQLEPGGVLLNHGIVTRERGRRGKKSTFVSSHVFPDGELETIDFVIGEAEAAGWELRDAESLRAHYALTLRAWVANLEANRDEAIAATSDVVYRIWRLYMAGSAIAFEVAGISVFQTLLTDPSRPTTFSRRNLLAADDA
jgi:cyclopropane-fatty-acyl-phospholipid synthase